MNVAYETVVRVMEHAQAAFAGLNGLLIPRFCKEGALAAERLDEYLNLGVAKGAGEVGANSASSRLALSSQEGIRSRAEGSRNT